MKMKNIFLALFSFIAILLLSCPTFEEDGTDLVGTWISLDETEGIVFVADKTGIIVVGDMVVSFCWNISVKKNDYEGALKLVYDSIDGGTEMKIKYRFDYNTNGTNPKEILKLTFLDGGDTVSYKKK